MKHADLVRHIKEAKMLRLESIALDCQRKILQKDFYRTASPSQRRRYGNLYFNPEVLEEVK